MKAFRRSGECELSVDRILGSGEFVEQVIIEAEGKVKSFKNRLSKIS